MDFLNEETSKIQKHYQKIANKYDKSWEYSDSFINFISQKILKYLNLKASDIFVDLGCGTGIYTKKIQELVNFTNPVLCVDISSKMLEQIPQKQNLQTIEMDAIEFTRSSEVYDKVLMQYMIHHISNREELISNLFNKLNNKGQILIIRLAGIIDHPLFAAAKTRYEEAYKSSDALVQSMKNLGFKTSIETIDYNVSLEKDKYLKMVEERYMSILSSFNDIEIKEGIEEINGKYSDQTILNFPEHILFIIGQK